jgi:cob(I)alamin adenosyltransferase
MATIAYTGKGDTGETTLFGGLKAKKSSLRIEAYGAIDELNSYIGVCRAVSSKETNNILEKIQKDLFVLGADLANVRETKTSALRISEKETKHMEKVIDGINRKLPDLKKFILPAGTMSASHMHVARSICRRAERRAILLKESENINNAIIPYLNRLSSLLFVLARYENIKKKVKEEEWSS